MININIGTFGFMMFIIGAAVYGLINSIKGGNKL